MTLSYSGSDERNATAFFVHGAIWYLWNSTKVYKRQYALHLVSVVYSPSAKQRKWDARKFYIVNYYEGNEY